MPHAYADNTRFNNSVVADVYTIQHQAGCTNDVKINPHLRLAAQWHTDDASPSGIAYVDGVIWMAGLKGQRLWRIPLDGTTAAAAPQAFLTGEYGRLRTVVAAGGDKVWLVTSNTDGRGKPKSGDDRILELEVK